MIARRFSPVSCPSVSSCLGFTPAGVLFTSNHCGGWYPTLQLHCSTHYCCCCFCKGFACSDSCGYSAYIDDCFACLLRLLACCVCLLASLRACLPHLRACLLACELACELACLRACELASLRACLPQLLAVFTSCIVYSIRCC